MNGEASRTARWSDGLAASCEGLVHPGVADKSERTRHARMIGAMAVFPFLAGAALMQAVADRAAAPVVIAAISALLGLSFLAVLVLAWTGNRAIAGVAALAGGGVVLAIAAGLGGGLLSPLTLLLAAPAIESRFADGSPAAMRAGLAASGLGLLLAVVIAVLAGPASVTAWHWLVPVAYGITVWRRAGVAAPVASTDRPAAAPLEDVLDAVVLRLDPAGDVLDAGVNARRILSLQPELLLGGGLFERIHVGDRVAYLCAVSALREAPGTRHVEAKLRIPARNGAIGAEHRLFTIELIAAPGRSGITAILRDAKELADLRDALAETREAAKGTEVAKGRFLAAVSHELRTPLNAIIGFSDVLLHEMFGGFRDARQREYVGLIKESGDHLLSVVNSILDVSKIESGAYAIHSEPFVFRDAVDMCHAMMAEQARAKAIRFVNEVGGETGEIRGDRRAVQQVLINLVSNAIKFTPQGGEVRIGAGRVGSRLTFWVADTGIGIAEDDLARLGQPFMQVQNDYTRNFEGTGLGLSLVKGLVTLHHGAMSIESAPGEGTTVSVSLPVNGPAADGGVEGEDEAGAEMTFVETEIDHGPIRKTA